MFEQDWKRSVFIPVPRRAIPKIAQIIMQLCSFHMLERLCLKSLASLQQYVNQEIPDIQTGFQRGRGTRDQIANIHGIMEKAKEFQKSIYFCFIYYTKNFVCITTNWKILKEMKIPAHLTCFLRNLYAGQKATVRTRHGTTD